MATESGDLLRGDDFSVAISTQSSYRSINSNPIFYPVRRTSGRPTAKINYTEDPSVDPSQQGAEQIMESKDLTCEISSTVSKQSVNLLEQGIFATKDVVGVTGTDISATATGFLSASNAFGPLKVGDAFWVSGFSDSTINQLYIVESVSAGEIITTVPPENTEAAGLSISLKTSRQNSGKICRYNTVQTYAKDESAVGGIDYYTIYDAVFDSVSIEIPEEGLLSFTGSLIAESEVDGHRKITGQTYAEKPTDRSVTALAGSSNNVKSYYINGQPASCLLKTLSIEVSNNGEIDRAGACGSSIYVRGRPTFTGSTIVRSFSSNPFTWRDYAREGERIQIGVHLSHGGGDETFIMLRQCVVTEAPQSDSGGTIANTEASFACERDNDDNITMAIFRNW